MDRGSAEIASAVPYCPRGCRFSGRGLRRELEHDAATVGPIILGRPKDVPFLLVKDDSCLGQGPICAVVLGAEAVEDCLLALRRELKYDAASRDVWAAGGVAVSTAVVGGSIEVSLLVENQRCSGTQSVGAAGLGTEAVEYCLLALRRELEYDAARAGAVLLILSPAELCRTIEVPLSVEDQPCQGIRAVGAAGMRTEAVKDCLLAFRRELEYDTATTGIADAVLISAGVGCPIQVSLLVEDHSGIGLCTIGAVGLRTEAVEDCLLAFWTNLEYDATSEITSGTVGTAVPGRPVQVSLRVEDHSCPGVLPIGAAKAARWAETVQHCLAFWRELEYGSLSVISAVVGRPVQVPLLVENHSCDRPLSVGAAGLRTEGIEDGLLAFGTDLKYDTGSVAISGAPALLGRPIQVSIRADDHPCVGELPISATGFGTEAVRTLGLGPRRTKQHTNGEEHLHDSLLREKCFALHNASSSGRLSRLLYFFFRG